VKQCETLQEKQIDRESEISEVAELQQQGELYSFSDSIHFFFSIIFSSPSRSD